MKKLLLLGFSLTLAVLSFSQTRARISNTQINRSVQRAYAPNNEKAPEHIARPLTQAPDRSMWPYEWQIGTTFYDKQTRASIGNRFYRYNDGSIAFVWTRAMTAPGNWQDLGTGYNFFGGTEWENDPASRIESVRTESPTYAPLGAGGEIIVSRDSANLHISMRSLKGTGAWIESSLAGPAGTNLSYPRVVTNGTDRNTIHLLTNSYNAWQGQTQALLYSRSQDGSVSWDINCVVIPGTGAGSYTWIGGDSYIWAEPRANTLAFLVYSEWSDMFLMKSTDNGESWTKTIIWQHPYPMWDWNTSITTDTIWCPESAAIALDENGKAHVALGIGRVAHPVAGTAYSFWPYTDGIGYWNEDMPPFTNANQHKALCTYPGYLVENVNLIGWMQDMNQDGVITLIDPPYSYNPQIGMSTMPSISIDENNQVYVAYASLMENLDNTLFNYKHIWSRASLDGGHTWYGFYAATNDPIHSYDECLWPQFSANSDENLYLVYNADDYQGLTISDPPGHAPEENRQNFIQIPKYVFYMSPMFVLTSSSPASGGTTTGSGNYYSGCHVELVATPAVNYKFLNWTENGIVVSTSAVYSFVIYQSHTLVANFYPDLGIPDQAAACKIYPNPASGQFMIESGNREAADISELSLINATGCLVYKKTNDFRDRIIVDLSDQSPGIYSLRIIFKDGRVNTIKIVCIR